MGGEDRPGIRSDDAADQQAADELGVHLEPSVQQQAKAA